MQYISYKNSTVSEEQRKINNTTYIQEQLIKQKNYFDEMFKKVDPNIILDEDQRRIILTDEDNTMIIAGAGAGKTTTIAAKVNYLTEKHNIKDKEILIITFTNKAVEELKERINRNFRHGVKITTFHKLGYEILKDNTKYKFKIQNNPETIIQEYIEQEKTKVSKQQDNIEKLRKYLKLLKKSKNTHDQSEQNKKIITYCLEFINLVKSKQMTHDEIKKIKIKTKRDKKILKVLQEIYIYYETKLKTTNSIDFNDMIIESEKILSTQPLQEKYKYIIIDEYQDISECRFNLIKTISNKHNSKIIVVGDDWQSIYGFAASNINLFTQFKQKIGYCEILKIQNTYRNSQQLIDIAGKFIQKNQNQIKKQLKSKKQNRTPISIIKYGKNQTKKFIQILEYIINKYGPQKNILVLGRYTFDKNEIIDNQILKENKNIIKYENYPNVKIEYMTIHSAKGLGYDNVILINAKNDKLGFPSKIKNNSIIKELITTEATIKYPEERRLMYVALTRTKNEIIIMTPTKKQSEFIKELKKYKNIIIKSNI